MEIRRYIHISHIKEEALYKLEFGDDVIAKLIGNNIMVNDAGKNGLILCPKKYTYCNTFCADCTMKNPKRWIALEDIKEEFRDQYEKYYGALTIDNPYLHIAGLIEIDTCGKDFLVIEDDDAENSLPTL